MTLTDFLLARITEDEAVARGATPGAWHADELYATVTADPYVSARAAYDHGMGRDCWVIPESMDSGVGDHNLAHIAKHHPARVLAECEAKRQIVELNRPQYAVLYRESERLLASAFDQEKMRAEAASGPIWPTPKSEATLLALAAVYADHPDFREEWRVS